MKHFLCLLLVAGVSIFPSIAQVNYTANDIVKPYTGSFGYGSNVGYFENWTAEELGDIAIGSDFQGTEGVGVNTLRPALFEHFMEQWGYEFRIKTFEHYRKLGAKDNVVFVGYPSEAHRDPTYYCGDKQSELFANLYEPVWDNGENGTPYNDENYYAAYLYKTVQLYKPYVKFWEIWNEPDFSFTANSTNPPGHGESWWDVNPAPCDYDIHAPIFHYIRMLRISYEVIKTIDPEAYVAIGGIGYPSFLDGVLRNTDNPKDGSVSSEFPLTGGAYFDVLSFHTYPHIDNSLRAWSNELWGFIYNRNTDAAVDGVLDLRDRFKDVLLDHGYDGEQYLEKEWIITESNVPRKPLNRGFGSDEVQRNFIIKTLVEVQKEKIHQFHIFTLGDKFDYKDAKNIYDEYHLMGLFQNLYKASPQTAKPNDTGVAYKTTSDLLGEKRFDHHFWERMDLPAGVRGGVFTDEAGVHTFVLWAATTKDNSEEALQVLNLKQVTGINEFVLKRWDYALTKDSSLVKGDQIPLTGEPVFLTKPESDFGIAPPMPGQLVNLEIYPNPFMLDVTVGLEVEEDERWKIRILNQLGLPVKILANDERLEQGYHHWNLDGTALEPGIYFLEYRNEAFQQPKRVPLIKMY